MTYETAHKLSALLTARGISHTLSVGIHENFVPAIQAHVEVSLDTLRRRGILEGVQAINDCAQELGLELTSSMLASGIGFTEPRPKLP